MHYPKTQIPQNHCIRECIRWSCSEGRKQVALEIKLDRKFLQVFQPFFNLHYSSHLEYFFIFPLYVQSFLQGTWADVCNLFLFKWWMTKALNFGINGLLNNWPKLLPELPGRTKITTWFFLVHVALSNLFIMWLSISVDELVVTPKGTGSLPAGMGAPSARVTAHSAGLPAAVFCLDYQSHLLHPCPNLEWSQLPCVNWELLI